MGKSKHADKQKINAGTTEWAAHEASSCSLGFLVRGEVTEALAKAAFMMGPELMEI